VFGVAGDVLPVARMIWAALSLHERG